MTIRVRLQAAGLTAALALSLLACGEDAATRSLRAEARRLERQNETLRNLIQATTEKRLVAAHWLAVAVDEAAVKTVIEATLPQEVDVSERWHVRVEKAEVSFRSGASLVKLDARVTDRKNPERLAHVVYAGGLDDIKVGVSGLLESRVLIDGVELPETWAAGADTSQLGEVASQFAGQNLEVLQGLVPEVAIPVRLRESIRVDGFGDGPVQVDPGEIPVNATVARVLPLSGRLWVFLDVQTGPWRKGEAKAKAP